MRELSFHCFSVTSCWGAQMLTLCWLCSEKQMQLTFILNLFSLIFLGLFSLTPWLFVCRLTSTFWWTSPVSITDFQFHCIVVRKHFVWFQFFWISWALSWRNIWSLLENAPCALERNVYCPVVGGAVLWMFVRSIGLECCSNLVCLPFRLLFYPSLKAMY